jgi:hypothetical protein
VPEAAEATPGAGLPLRTQRAQAGRTVQGIQFDAIDAFGSLSGRSAYHERHREKKTFDASQASQGGAYLRAPGDSPVGPPGNASGSIQDDRDRHGAHVTKCACPNDRLRIADGDGERDRERLLVEFYDLSAVASLEGYGEVVHEKSVVLRHDDQEIDLGLSG